MKYASLFLFLLTPVICNATSIMVGSTNLEIPNPKGFTAVTSDMHELYEIQKQFVAPTNEEFVTFIPEGDVPAVMNGDIPQLPRRFTVQTAKKIVSVSVSNSDFVGLRKSLKEGNEQVFKKLEQDAPGLMDKLNKGVLEKYDVDLATSMSQIVPLPFHEETERTIAYSSFVKYSMKDAPGNPFTFITCVTATFVHVKGKVIFLYAYSAENDLEWNRRMSKQWSDAVVAANPVDASASVKEALPSSVSNLGWGKIGGKAVIGGFLALIVGVGAAVANRRKNS